MLKKIDTKAPKSVNKEKIKAKTKKLHEKLEALHKMMRAENKHSLLVVFQGMDASGKDGSVDKLYNGLSPMAANVHAFKAPSELEASKNFLWRIHQLAPSTGFIQIFNRSHYEDILVPSVNRTITPTEASKRFKHINDFEELLTDSGTKVVKFYLHISRDEQTKRFNERLTNVEKKWKYSCNDLVVAEQWDEYMKVYENIFQESKIKWNIIPADDKWYRDYLIADKLVDVLKGLKMEYPNTLK